MKALLSPLLGLLSLSLSPVAASPLDVWSFTGTCTDCGGTATGTLTVDQGQFFFQYQSAWIAYLMHDASVRVDGETKTPGAALGILPGMEVRITVPTMSLTSFGGTNGQYTNPLPPGPHLFSTYGFRFTSVNGIWSTGANVPLDFGVDAQWSLGSNNQSSVPEPSTFALLASAAAAGGLARRRRASR